MDVHVSRWIQKELQLPEFPRGFHLITRHVLGAIPELAGCTVGLLHVFLRHTSASLTLQENADPDVCRDLAMAFDRLAPESWPWVHTIEGADDMPAHVKAALTGSSLSIPVSRGQLCTGTWQGICLCEHRNHGGRRRLVLTLHGEFPEEP
jgi:secondary thiamine-phosphate synthase enzyme